VEFYTVNASFGEEEIIDQFSSGIWTERYYGDSDCQLTVPATSAMITKLGTQKMLGLNGSDEIMMIDTQSFDSGKMTVNGTSLTQQLNNRFIRTTNDHSVKTWLIPAAQGAPGQILGYIVQQMCISSSYLNGSTNTGISNPTTLMIPNFYVADLDASDPAVDITVPFGPVYDALKTIAQGYLIGMKVARRDASSVLFRTYKGINRSSSQNVNGVIRFSPQLDSFTNIKELKSTKDYKTAVYAYASGQPAQQGTQNTANPPYGNAGGYTLNAPPGFGLRAEMLLLDDITTALPNLIQLLQQRSKQELLAKGPVAGVDGEIVATSQYKYGVHFKLGDIIDVQGLSGSSVPSRVTEYIRSQDATGEKAYPTVVAV
jgi:hypothetical protein